MVKLIDMIGTIARMRDMHHFDDESSFVNIEPDSLTRRPRLTVVFFDTDNDWEITISKVMRNED
jgi:hypothetical protein